MELYIQHTRDRSFITITIESGNAKISEDISDGYELSEQFTSAVFELNRLERISDVDTCISIFEAFLNDTEKAEFIEKIT